MKKMNKIALVLVLFASTQAFAWVIRFDDNALNKKYDVLTFETKGDYDRMLRQANGGKAVNQAALTIAPLVGKASGAAAKVVPDPEFKAAMVAVNTASGLLVKVLKTGLVQKSFGALTKEGYTVDYISGFEPTSKNNYKCKDAKSLKDHVIHPIKSNKTIFYVVYDKKTNKVLYSQNGLAYGVFNFTLGELQDEKTKEKHLFGNLELLDSTGGKGCPKDGATFKGHIIHKK